MFREKKFLPRFKLNKFSKFIARKPQIFLKIGQVKKRVFRPCFPTTQNPQKHAEYAKSHVRLARLFIRLDLMSIHITSNRETRDGIPGSRPFVERQLVTSCCEYKFNFVWNFLNFSRLNGIFIWRLQSDSHGFMDALGMMKMLPGMPDGSLDLIAQKSNSHSETFEKFPPETS